MKPVASRLPKRYNSTECCFRTLKIDTSLLHNWSFVGSKGQQIWVWIALEHQTRRIVGLAFADRTTETWRKLWESLPPDYRKRAICSSDFWEPYAKVLPSKRHRPVGKETGETAHIERFNNTLRQRCANVDHYNRQLEYTGYLASV